MTTLVEETNRVEDEAHVLVILDRDGDTRITWDPDNEDDVENAREVFNRLVTEKKYQAFSVVEGGEKGELVREFDPEAEKLIMSPALVGG